LEGEELNPSVRIDFKKGGLLEGGSGVLGKKDFLRLVLRWKGGGQGGEGRKKKVPWKGASLVGKAGKKKTRKDLCGFGRGPSIFWYGEIREGKKIVERKREDLSTKEED